LLYEEANIIYVNVLKNFASGEKKLSPQFAESLRYCANRIEKIDERGNTEISIVGIEDTVVTSNIKEVNEIINGTSQKITEKIQLHIPSNRQLFKRAIHQNSIVFISSIRYAIILLIALLIAFSFGFERSYWIPLSCAAVLLGSTVISTFHRSLQRAAGTIIGVIIASVLLYLQPDGFLIAIYILMLTFLTELFIPINYAIAVLFLTSTAILMTENATQVFDVGILQLYG
jgi:uncharacterized membrane protein YccC